jgi:hypothetical protein
MIVIRSMDMAAFYNNRRIRQSDCTVKPENKPLALETMWNDSGEVNLIIPHANWEQTHPFGPACRSIDHEVRVGENASDANRQKPAIAPNDPDHCGIFTGSTKRSQPYGTAVSI